MELKPIIIARKDSAKADPGKAACIQCGFHEAAQEPDRRKSEAMWANCRQANCGSRREHYIIVGWLAPKEAAA